MRRLKIFTGLFLSALAAASAFMTAVSADESGYPDSGADTRYEYVSDSFMPDPVTVEPEPAEDNDGILINTAEELKAVLADIKKTGSRTVDYVLNIKEDIIGISSADFKLPPVSRAKSITLKGNGSRIIRLTALSSVSCGAPLILKDIRIEGQDRNGAGREFKLSVKDITLDNFASDTLSALSGTGDLNIVSDTYMEYEVKSFKNVNLSEGVNVYFANKVNVKNLYMNGKDTVYVYDKTIQFRDVYSKSSAESAQTGESAGNMFIYRTEMELSGVRSRLNPIKINGDVVPGFASDCRVRLGIQQPDPEVEKAIIGIKTAGGTDGVTVVSFMNGSHAGDAGLLVGDIITEADGIAVTTTAELTAVTNNMKIGDILTLTVKRDGADAPIEIEVELIDAGETQTKYADEKKNTVYVDTSFRGGEAVLIFKKFYLGEDKDMQQFVISEESFPADRETVNYELKKYSSEVRLEGNGVLKITKGGELMNFEKWSELIDHIQKHPDPEADYTVSMVSDYSIDTKIKSNMPMPKLGNYRKITIVTDPACKDENGDPKQATFSFYGNLLLTGNIELNNIILNSHNGKRGFNINGLQLYDITLDSISSASPIKNVTGKNIYFLCTSAEWNAPGKIAKNIDNYWMYYDSENAKDPINDADNPLNAYASKLLDPSAYFDITEEPEIAAGKDGIKYYYTIYNESGYDKKNWYREFTDVYGKLYEDDYSFIDLNPILIDGNVKASGTIRFGDNGDYADKTRPEKFTDDYCTHIVSVYIKGRFEAQTFEAADYCYMTINPAKHTSFNRFGSEEYPINKIYLRLLDAKGKTVPFNRNTRSKALVNTKIMNVNDPDYAPHGVGITCNNHNGTVMGHYDLQISLVCGAPGTYKNYTYTQIRDFNRKYKAVRFGNKIYLSEAGDFDRLGYGRRDNYAVMDNGKKGKSEKWAFFMDTYRDCADLLNRNYYGHNDWDISEDTYMKESEIKSKAQTMDYFKRTVDRIPDTYLWSSYYDYNKDLTLTPYSTS